MFVICDKSVHADSGVLSFDMFGTLREYLVDLRQLEMFLAVAENNSFTRASQRLHVAQSAISRKVAMLESELGVKLFKRMTKRIYLTTEGETFLRYTRKVFQNLRDGVLEVSETAQLKRGRVSIAAGMIACNYMLPPVLERLKELYPRLDLQVVTGPTERLVADIRNNEVDLGLLTLPIDYPDLEVIPYCSEELVVVSSPKHEVLSKKKSISPEELSRFPLIVFQKGAHTRKVLDKFFEDTAVKPIIYMESDNVATIKPLIKINLGVTIIPLRAVADEVKRKELHSLRVRGYDLRRHLGLVFHKSEHVPKVVTELIRLFGESKER